ncbi:MAG: PQQ-binding-like beta-propeller repeat protein [Phycisphaerales bacterium]|nr:MAG: PQQ-binding-like beta-propeller repeat protein [Phycisphaerales bacterium]
MKVRGVKSTPGHLLLLILSVALAGCATTPQWTQWGGPNRNFMVEATDLADEWPEDGPPKLWHRELGDGYSTIAVQNGVLYTMYRTEQDEYTVALDAASGDTIWEHKNPSPTTGQMNQFGPGPHTTPLIVGNRLFSIGTNAVMHCYDKRTGDVLWKHDLPEEFGAPIPGYGYANSPILYKNTIIIPVDHPRPEEEEGEDAEEDAAEEEVVKEEVTEPQTLVAFDLKSGDVVWKNQDFKAHYASPILIDFRGEEQLVLLMEAEMIGVNPNNGELLWKHEFDPPGYHCAMPLWTADDILFVSAAYNIGSRAVQLTKQDGKTVPKELWYSKKLRIHHGNAIPIGDHIYGSSGDFGTALVVCLDTKTGKAVWRKRGFAKATFVYADGKLILFDEEGKLALVTATPEGLTVHSECKVAERTSWAAPTLVGKTLYVRDRRHIMAFDVG